MGDPPPRRPARTPQRPLSLGPRRRTTRPPQQSRYRALRARGYSHGRALRTVGDRLLAVACAMLKTAPSTTPSSPETSSPPEPLLPRKKDLQGEPVGRVGNAPLSAADGEQPPPWRRVFQVLGKSLPLPPLPDEWPLLPPRFPQDGTFHGLPETTPSSPYPPLTKVEGPAFPGLPAIRVVGVPAVSEHPGQLGEERPVVHEFVVELRGSLLALSEAANVAPVCRVSPIHRLVRPAPSIRRERQPPRSPFVMIATPYPFTLCASSVARKPQFEPPCPKYQPCPRLETRNPTP